MALPNLNLSLLGSFQATRNDEPLAFAGDKVRALLAYLAVEGSRRQAHRREALAGLLWPNYPDSDALVNLRQTLHRLRRSLGDEGSGQDASPGLLVVTPQTVHLAPGSYSLDVDEFNSLVEACRQHRHRKLSRCTACHKRLLRAAELYRGDLLAGFFLSDSPPFDEWLLLAREALRRQVLGVFDLLAGYYEAHSDYSQALTYAYRPLELEPWREESHRQVMRLLLLDGQRSAALAQYQTCRHVLLDELGTGPEPETVALYEWIKSDGIETGSREQANHNSQHHNLPHQTSRFVGREAELEAITERLESAEVRLVTLVGPGGAGKTRLGVQAALGQVGSFEDGVWYVPLAPVNSRALLVTSVAQALRLRLGSVAAREPEAELFDYLRDKEMLLLLDNFEQLLEEGVGLLVSLLAGAPKLTILVTSREYLGLQAEHIFDIAGLPVPATDNVAPLLSRVLDSGAAQLFAERAQQAQWDFIISAENAQGVADVCRLVGGLPLGIVLAAAWVRRFSPSEIAQSIAESLDFLTSSMRDASPQHRSLRAVFNHSWNLLSDEEKSVFRRLSIFNGGWEEEAAAKVTGVTPQILSALIDKSLSRRDASGRYDIHEVLRQYASEQLRLQEAEQVNAAARHAAYFLAMAEMAEGVLQGSEQAAWFARLDLEHGNIRGALRWATSGQPFDSHGQSMEPTPHEVGLRLAAAMGRFWEVRGYAREGQEWLAAALKTKDSKVGSAETTNATYARAKALIAAASIARSHGNYNFAQALCEESLAIFRQLEDKAGVARVLNIMGTLARRQGDYTAARSLYIESLEIQREFGNMANISALLGNLGNIAHEQRDYKSAKKYQEESLLISKVLGDREAISSILGSLGLIAHDLEEYETAKQYQQESLSIRRELGNKPGIASALSNLGEISFEQEKYDEARSLLLESLSLREELLDKRGIAFSLVILGHVYRAQGDDRAAHSSFLESLRLSWSLGDRYLLIWCLEGLAMAEVLKATPTIAQHAAHLLGAAEALRDALGSSMPSNYRRRYQQQVATVQEFLSVESFRDAWQEGRTLPLEQIVTAVLGEV